MTGQVYAAGPPAGGEDERLGRNNRPATSELFADELPRAVKDLESVAHRGTPSPAERRPLLKRLLLEKTKCQNGSNF